MQSDSLVTLIIPIYQAEQYLNNCLETIVHQTYDNLEIILVDDGSTDKSSLLCDEWAMKDTRIKIIHKKNEGRSIARNVGLNNATGDYIVFVDSDDWISNTMIEKLIKNLECTNADMSICQFINVFSDGRMKKNTTFNSGIKLFNRKEFFSLLLKDDVITNHLWRVLFKRKMISGVKFPSQMDFEDIYTMPDLVRLCKKIVYTDDAEYFYRFNDKSIVHRVNVNQYYDHYLAITRSYYRIVELEPSLRKNADIMLVQKLMGILKEIYDNEDKLINVDKKNKLIKKIKKSLKESTSITKLGKRDRLFYYLLFNFPIVSRLYFRMIGSDHSKLMELKGHWERFKFYEKK